MAKEQRRFLRFLHWGNSRVLPIANNGTRRSQSRATPFERADGMPVETERPPTDLAFALLFLWAMATLSVFLNWVTVLTWILAAPLILLLLGTEIHQPLNMNRVALTLVCLVFAVPGACYYNIAELGLFGPFGTIFAVLFSSSSFSVGSDLTTGFVMIILQAIPQLVFIGDLSRYYKGGTTRRNAVLIGIAGQIPFGALIALGYVLTPPPGLSVLFPLPFALVIGLVIMWLFPPQS
jgi:hypothetical protein